MLFARAKKNLYFALSLVVVVCLLGVAGVFAEQVFYEDFSGDELSEAWLELRSHPSTPDAQWPLALTEVDGRDVLAINIEKGVDIRGEIWTNAVEAGSNVVVVELKYMVKHDLFFDFVPGGKANLLVMPSSDEWIPALEIAPGSWLAGLEPNQWYKMRVIADASKNTAEISVVKEEQSYESALFPLRLPFRQRIGTWDKVSVRFLISDRAPAETGTIYIDEITVHVVH